MGIGILLGGMSRTISYGYDTPGKSKEPWNTLQPTDKNGIVKITIVWYAWGIDS